MNGSAKKTTKKLETVEENPRFAAVAQAFTKDLNVTRGNRKGFGSRALTVGGKIFAMMSSKGEFVVKLPAERVAELVASGEGEYFDSGRGRRMKEWLAITAGRTSWIELAKEAYRYIKQSR